MTPAELWDRINALADRLAPDVARAFVRALATLRTAVSLAEIERLVAAGDVDALVARLFDAPAAVAALGQVRSAVAGAFVAAGPQLARATPPVRLPDGQGLVRVAFDALHPAALEAARRYNAATLTRLSAEMKAGVRQVVTDGLFAGDGPRALAPRVKAFVGLTTVDHEWIASFRRGLASGDAAVLARTLRDARFDATVRKAIASVAKGGPGLPAAKIDAMVARYTERLHAHRAATVARTATLDSVRLANRALWAKAVADGVARPELTVRRWVTRLDGRERPQHHRMHNQRVRYGEPFVDKATGRTWDYVGELDYNCRCVEFIRPYLSADEVAAQLAASPNRTAP